MNKLLQSILETKTFRNSEGKVIEVHSETSKQQCEFLQSIIQDNKFKNSLEIGFAFGASTLAITEAVAQNGGYHLVIDKFENSHWGGSGLDLLQQAGYSEKLEFKEEFCYRVLPKLLEDGRKFDFTYIDSTKQFDWLLVDFFYIDKILETNGIIVFDDAHMPGIRKLIRFITQFPNYKLYSQFPKNLIPSKPNSLKKGLKYLPKAENYFKEDILKSDFELHLNATCAAIIKLGEDTRNWDWHQDF